MNGVCEPMAVAVNDLNIVNNVSRVQASHEHIGDIVRTLCPVSRCGS